jgi:hypothetical protein
MLATLEVEHVVVRQDVLVDEVHPLHAVVNLEVTDTQTASYPFDAGSGEGELYLGLC